MAYHDPDSRYENESPLVDVPDAGDEETFHKILEWWRQVQESQSINRIEQALDRDFYDGLQLSDEERRELIDRGQPPITKNLIAPAIDWILGTEKRTRMDFRVYPKEDSDQANENAMNKTKLLKHTSDVNKAGYARSRAFEDCVVAGVGWLEDGIRNDESDELAYSRFESWMNVWYDHLSVEKDLSDARYVFRQKWVDLDIALAMFPDKAVEIRSAAVSHDRLGGTDDDEFYSLSQVYYQTDSQGYALGRSSLSDEPYNVNNRRTRVKLVECWYKEPTRVTKLRGYETPLNGQEFDRSDDRHVSAVYEEIVSTYDALVMKVRCAMFCSGSLLQDTPTPYKHNRFPFTAVWGKRRGRDNAPYGAVRAMRDAQRDYNARASKALQILATRKIIAESDAVEDWDEALEQAAAPDGVIRLKPGAGAQGKRFDLITENELAEEHVMLMQRSADYMQRASGVTDENLGLDTKAVSGKAILAKQNEGSVVTFQYFDNLRFAAQLQGEKQLSNIEQFYDMPRIVRVIGDNAKHEFVRLNEPVFDPISGQMVVQNDLTADKADFVVDTEDFRATVRQAQFEAMMEMVTRLPPEMAIQILDLVVEMSDLSGKEEWVKRIRSMNGHRDPDEKETPEQQQERAQAEAEAQRQKELSDAQIEAEIAKKQAEVEKLKADAERLKATATLSSVESVEKATEAAATMASIPEVAPIADELLDSAGFEDKADVGSIDIPRPQVPALDKKVTEAAKEHRSPTPVQPTTEKKNERRK